MSRLLYIISLLLNKKALEAGMVPLLYTDLNYEASNHVYKKVGYKEKEC